MIETKVVVVEEGFYRSNYSRLCKGKSLLKSCRKLSDWLVFWLYFVRWFHGISQLSAPSIGFSVLTLQELVVSTSLLCRHIGETSNWKRKRSWPSVAIFETSVANWKYSTMRQDFCLENYINSTVPSEAVYKVLSGICLVSYFQKPVKGNVTWSEKSFKWILSRFRSKYGTVLR